MTGLEQNNLPEKGFFDNITKGLKDLMEKITGGINDILVKLGLKKDKEIKGITEKTQEELNDLKNLIEINSRISAEEQKIIDKTIKDNTDIKKYFDWIGKTFKRKDKIMTKEKENLLAEIKDHDGEKSADDLKNFIEKEKNAMEKIKNDTKLKEIVVEIDGDYAIEEIVLAHETLKEEDEENITKQKIIDKITTLNVGISADTETSSEIEDQEQ